MPCDAGGGGQHVQAGIAGFVFGSGENLDWFRGVQ